MANPHIRDPAVMAAIAEELEANSRPTHPFAGDEHTPSTVAEVNEKISDGDIGSGSSDSSGRRYIGPTETVTVPDNCVLFVDADDFALDGVLVLGAGAVLRTLVLDGDDISEQVLTTVPEDPEPLLAFYDTEDPEDPEIEYLQPGPARGVLGVPSVAEMNAAIAAAAQSFLPLSPVIYDNVTLPPTPLALNITTQLSDLFIAGGPGSVTLPTLADGAVNGDFIGIQHTGTSANPLTIDPQITGAIRYLDGAVNSNPVQLSMPAGVMVFRFIDGAWHPFCGTHVQRFLRQADGFPWMVDYRETNGAQAVARILDPNSFYTRDALNGFQNLAVPPNSIPGRFGGAIATESFVANRFLASLPSGVLGANSDDYLRHLFSGYDSGLGIVHYNVNVGAETAWLNGARPERFIRVGDNRVGGGSKIHGVTVVPPGMGDNGQSFEKVVFTNSILLWKHESATAADPTYRIRCPHNVDFYQPANTVVHLVWETVSQRWRIVSFSEPPMDEQLVTDFGGGNIDIPLYTALNASVTITGNRVARFSVWEVVGEGIGTNIKGRRGVLRVIQGGAGGHLITDYQVNFNSALVKHPGGVAPVLSGAAGAQDLLEWYFDGTYLHIKEFLMDSQ